MKNLISAFFVFAALSSGAFAKSFARNISCMPAGHTGFILKGTYIMETKTRNGSVEVTSTKLKVKSFSFLLNGAPGSSVPAFEAVTKINGDGDDRVFSKYSKTTSPRILSIGLVLSEESDEQDETVVKTSKGNKYFASCSFDGVSGR
jgi:hypothetical protein